MLAWWAEVLRNLPDKNRKNYIMFNFGKQAILGGKDIILGALDAFLHFLIVGPTGGGKTALTLSPAIRQALEGIRDGKNIVVSVIAPDDSLPNDVAEWCREFNIPYVYLNPADPNTDRLNPLQGDATIVAEVNRTVLSGMFGKQEAFFQLIQETMARNFTLLLKELRADKLEIIDVVRVLRDEQRLASAVQELLLKMGESDLAEYFTTEVLGKSGEKLRQFAMGLRQQLEDIAGNEYLRRVMTGDSSINFDKFLEGKDQVKVFLVNTEVGLLGKLGDTFGMFVMMHLQAAIFRRPGNQWTRIPFYWFVDEAPRYLNEKMDKLLTMGRKFRVSLWLVIQNLSQLDEVGKSFRGIVKNNARNKIIMAGLSQEDTRDWELEFGKVKRRVEEPTYSTVFGMKMPFAKSVKIKEVEEPRFSSTYITDLPADNFIYRFVYNRQLLAPAEGIARFVNQKSGGQILMEAAKEFGSEAIVRSKNELLTIKRKLQPPKQTIQDRIEVDYETRSGQYEPNAVVESTPDINVNTSDQAKRQKPRKYNIILPPNQDEQANILVLNEPESNSVSLDEEPFVVTDEMLQAIHSLEFGEVETDSENTKKQKKLPIEADNFFGG